MTKWAICGAFMLLIAGLAGCTPPEPESALVVTLIADGRQRSFALSAPTTVGEFLRDPNIAVEFNPATDRVNPPEFTQIIDGMRITVVRVEEQVVCEQEEIPYRTETVLNEGLAPGDERLARGGQNGTQETCFRLRIEDQQEMERTQISQTVIVEPQNEIVYVGPSGELEPVAVNGTIAYISRGNAWIIRGNSTVKRPLTNTGDLDQHVFSIAPNGKQLLFTRRSNTAGTAFLNELWYIPDVTLETPQLIRLDTGDVLYADWIPGQDNSFSYSTAQVRESAPGWQALNDLWIARIDPLSGVVLNVEQVLEQSGGLYSWWGSEYHWSPDGQRLAVTRANFAGVVDLETGEITPLFQYEAFRTFADWSWRATISWSADGQLIASTVHGLPIGDEPADTSPVFNIAVTDVNGGFQTEIVEAAGMWAAPRFSPVNTAPDSQFPQGYMAYLRARVPYESVNGEYDLIIADRDGSNARRIFPQIESAVGLRAQQFAADFSWSPDGTQLAFIYQGDLWIIDVQTEVANRLTLDGGASKPIWTR